MTEQLYTLHVDQWPSAVDVTVRIIQTSTIKPTRVMVEAIEGYPFISGSGRPVLSSDVWWYKQRTADMSQLTALQPAPAKPENDPTSMDWLPTPEATDDPTGYARTGY
jgi:hypothetical protein